MESSNNNKTKVDKLQTCLVVDGSETSDLGSSGGEDVPSFDEWPTAPSVSLENQVNSETPSTDSVTSPETALEKLEKEVLAEAEKEQRDKKISIKKLAKLERASEKESAIQAVNSSIVNVNKSKNEVAEATIIDEDDTSSSLEELTSVPAIRHSVVIELNVQYSYVFMSKMEFIEILIYYPNYSTKNYSN